MFCNRACQAACFHFKDIYPSRANSLSNIILLLVCSLILILGQQKIKASEVPDYCALKGIASSQLGFQRTGIQPADQTKKGRPRLAVFIEPGRQDQSQHMQSEPYCMVHSRVVSFQTASPFQTAREWSPAWCSPAFF